jgi:hypothetical protein
VQLSQLMHGAPAVRRAVFGRHDHQPPSTAVRHRRIVLDWMHVEIGDRHDRIQ